MAGEPRAAAIRREALRLFGERGYRGTTIADIESSVGLARGSGGVYKHFDSKAAIFNAAVEEHLVGLERSIERLERDLDLLPSEDLAAALLLVGRVALAGLGGEADLMRLLFKNGEQFPEIVHKLRDQLLQAEYRTFARWLSGRTEGLGEAVSEAVAAVAYGALVNYKATEIMLGEAPACVPEESFLAAWTEIVEGYLRAKGGTWSNDRTRPAAGQGAARSSRRRSSSS